VIKHGQKRCEPIAFTARLFLKYELQTVPGVYWSGADCGMVNSIKWVLNPDKFARWICHWAHNFKSIKRGNQRVARRHWMAEAETCIRASGYIQKFERHWKLIRLASVKRTPHDIKDVVRWLATNARGLAELTEKAKLWCVLSCVFAWNMPKKPLKASKQSWKTLKSSLPKELKSLRLWSNLDWLIAALRIYGWAAGRIPVGACLASYFLTFMCVLL